MRKLDNGRSNVNIIVSKICHRIFSTGFGVTIADQVVVSLGNLISVALIARLCGIQQFGLFSLIWMLIQLTQMVVSAVVITPMINDRAKLPARYHKFHDRVVLEHGLVLSIIVTLVFLFSALLIRFFHPGALLWGSDFWAASAIFVLTFADFVRRRAFAVRKPSNALGQDIIRYALLLSALLSLQVNVVVYDVNETVAFAILAFANGIAILYGFSQQGIGQSNNRLRWFVWKKQRKQAAALGLDTIVGFLSSNLQFFMLSTWLGPAALGGVRAGYNVARFSSVFTQATQNWFPALQAKYYSQGGLVELKKISIRASVFFGTAQIPILLLIIFKGSDIMMVLYGAEYKEYTGIMIIFAACQVIVGMQVAMIGYFRVLSASGVLLRARCITAVISIASIYPLVSLFGAQGAAWVSFVSAITFSTLTILSFVTLRRLNGAQ